MRYYSINIEDRTKNNAIVPVFTTLLPNGRTDLGALNVELDIPVAPFHEPSGGAFVRVWGIPLSYISQAKNLFQFGIQVYGGMAAGLPLAKPKQAGLLVSGFIYQCYANWIGTEQTLELTVYAGTGTLEKPINLVLNWAANTPLSQALQNALSIAFPGYKIKIQISPNLIQANNEVSFHGTLNQFAARVYDLSKAILGQNNPSYQGVSITVGLKSINVFDGTVPGTVKQIDYTDLIGQTTWIAPNTVQLSCVLRADINIGDTIKLPPQGLPITTTAEAYSQYQNTTTFTGNWIVRQMRHVGNFRVPDGRAWMTTINAFQAPASSSG